MEQHSDEWIKARLGKATASRIADIMARTKTGYSTSRANYEAELIAERLTGSPAERYQNAAMQWGTDTEPKARAAYSFYADVEVQTCGFIDHPSIGMAGASPDGLVGADGLLEIKCPSTATHLETLLGGSLPGKYQSQIAWQMACTGRRWCDFVSFDPRLPERMRLFVRRVERDDRYIAELEREVREFLSGIDVKIAELERLAA